MRPFPKIEPLTPERIAELNAMTPQQKLQIVDNLFVMVRDSIRATVREEHPDWTADEVQRETARRLLAKESPHFDGLR